MCVCVQNVVSEDVLMSTQGIRSKRMCVLLRVSLDECLAEIGETADDEDSHEICLDLVSTSEQELGY